VNQTTPFLDWSALRNPVLAFPRWSIKDACCGVRGDAFYLFFSAFYMQGDDLRCRVAGVRSEGLQGEPVSVLDLTGEEAGWRGMIRSKTSEESLRRSRSAALSR